MNLKEEIKKRSKILSEWEKLPLNYDLISIEKSEEIAESYAKEKAWDECKFHEGINADTPTVMKQVVRGQFEKRWEGNK